MSQIRSKIFQRGNPCEATCISDFGTGEKGLWGSRLVEGEVNEYGNPKYESVRYERAPAPEPKAPMIISDTIRHEVHPLTGKATDSRSTHRKMTREHNSIHGTAYDYRGSEKRVADNIPKFKEMSEDDYIRDTAIAREQVLSGTAPLTDYDKHVCKEINTRLKNKV